MIKFCAVKRSEWVKACFPLIPNLLHRIRVICLWLWRFHHERSSLGTFWTVVVWPLEPALLRLIRENTACCGNRTAIRSSGPCFEVLYSRAFWFQIQGLLSPGENLILVLFNVILNSYGCKKVVVTNWLREIHFISFIAELLNAEAGCSDSQFLMSCGN